MTIVWISGIKIWIFGIERASIKDRADNLGTQHARGLVVSQGISNTHLRHTSLSRYKGWLWWSGTMSRFELRPWTIAHALYFLETETTSLSTWTHWTPNYHLLWSRVPASGEKIISSMFCSHVNWLEIKWERWSMTKRPVRSIHLLTKRTFTFHRHHHVQDCCN